MPDDRAPTYTRTQPLHDFTRLPWHSHQQLIRGYINRPTT